MIRPEIGTRVRHRINGMEGTVVPGWPRQGARIRVRWDDGVVTFAYHMHLDSLAMASTSDPGMYSL